MLYFCKLTAATRPCTSQDLLIPAGRARALHHALCDFVNGTSAAAAAAAARAEAEAEDRRCGGRLHCSQLGCGVGHLVFLRLVSGGLSEFCVWRPCDRREAEQLVVKDAIKAATDSGEFHTFPKQWQHFVAMFENLRPAPSPWVCSESPRLT